jgi:nicotinate-nucleotide adenylyltransferase
MRLGLFGGSFDPVHYGHLLLAECCREQCELDQVWFLPAGVPPHKQDRDLTPAGQRIEMLELAIAGHDRFAVSRYETEQGGISYTVDTLRHFRDEDPDGELFFLMGADMLNDLPNWRDAATVCSLAVPAVVRRAGAAEPDFRCLNGISPAERIQVIQRHQVEMPQVDISSTEIRRRVGRGLSLRYLTPRAVQKYIQTHRLYA